MREWSFMPGGKTGAILRAHEKNRVQRLLEDNPNLFGAFRDREGNTLFKTMWHGEYPGKLLTGLALLYAMTGEETTRRTGDALAEGLLSTQSADGYLGPWDAAHRFEGCTDPTFSHEGDWGTYGRWDTWGQYHCIYGLYRWYKLTGEKRYLEAGMRALDCIYEHFITGSRSFVLQNWAECNLAVGHAFALYYAETGLPEYLQAAKHIVHTEWDAEYKDYYTRKTLCCGWLKAAENGVPFGLSGQPRWEGLYSLQTLAALYEATGETRYRDAVCTLWRDMSATDRHNTGSFGTGEGATGDLYGAGSETCNTVAWTAFSTDVLRLTKDSRIADELELSFFNAALGSLLAGERNFTYMNDSDGSRVPALEVLKEQGYDGARDMSCCQANGTRGLSQIADWALLANDSGLWLNWYGEAVFTGNTPQGHTLQLKVCSAYPADGSIRITLAAQTPEAFALRLRIPGWSANTVLCINGEKQTTPVSGSYYEITRIWQDGDVIALSLDMTLHFWPWAQGDKFSAYRGPLLLARQCPEEPDGLRFTPQSFAEAEPEEEFSADGEPTVAGAFTAQRVRAADGTPVRFTDYYSAGKDGGHFVTWLDAAAPLPDAAEPIWQSR